VVEEWEKRGIRQEPKVVKPKVKVPRVPKYDGIIVKFGALRT